MHYLEEVKKWLGEITEIFLLLVALGVVVEIVFGTPEASVPFFGGIVENLTGLIATLGNGGFAGLIALGIIVYLFQRRRVFAQQQ
ncbi:MAG: hypothetical protein ACYTAO_13320 [Planctomycetota bacterium]|jgi:hypothetical protein